MAGVVVHGSLAGGGGGGIQLCLNCGDARLIELFAKTVRQIGVDFAIKRTTAHIPTAGLGIKGTRDEEGGIDKRLLAAHGEVATQFDGSEGEAHGNQPSLGPLLANTP